MNLLQKLEAWFAAIWHHFHAGTLPDAPTVGNPATLPPINPGVVTPPAPPVPSPSPVPSSTLPPGVDSPDTVNGSVAIAALTPLYPLVDRWLIFATLPFVPVNSSAHACIALNCQNAAFADAHGMVYAEAFPAIEQPGADAIGAAHYRLDTQHGEIPRVRTVSNALTTVDAVVTFYTDLAAKVAANPNTPWPHP